MTQGNHASGRANARPDAIELTFIHADLAASIARLGTIVRFGASEQSHLHNHKGAARDVVLARWQQTNALLIEALAELDAAHARLDAAARHVFQAVGDADDRAEEREASQT